MRLKLVIITCLIVIASVSFTHAHDWYPYYCCAEHDCHPVDCEAIIDKGKEVIYHGLSFMGDMIRSSQDGQCHACIIHEHLPNNGDAYSPIPRCIFLQQGS